MGTDAFTDTQAVFRQAADGFVALVRDVDTADWNRPGLGEWTVRDLVGHTSRSLITVESYVGTESTDVLDGPVAYFLACRVVLATDNGVAQRGRDAGVALGDEPASRVAELAERVPALVLASAADTPVGTPFGTMTLAGYLPTRIFELAVHCTDLARALDLSTPPALAPAIASACDLAGQLARHTADPASYLMAVTGRSSLPHGFTVL